MHRRTAELQIADLLEQRRQPKRCYPEIFKVINLVDNSLQISTPVLAPILPCLIEETFGIFFFRTFLIASNIVTIMKTVYNQEINYLRPEVNRGIK